MDRYELVNLLASIHIITKLRHQTIEEEEQEEEEEEEDETRRRMERRRRRVGEDETR